MRRRFRTPFAIRLLLAAALALPGLVGDPARAQDSNAPTAADARLQAIFLEVDGKVRWRTGEKAAWKDAAVNDLLTEGAEVRTGLKSRAALRVGKNATVLVDAGTTFQIPTVVQEGETLRTLAAVKSGRVDFKVDKVGFANDFKVVTPQTTLSVRGTGFAVSSGPLAGVEVTGARTNAIGAIELRYVAANLRYFLSGSASSNSSRPDPVQNAWLSTLGPPQIAGLIADPKQLEQAASQGQAGNNPTNPQQLQQQAAAQSMGQLADDSPIRDLLRMQEDTVGQVRFNADGASGHAVDGLATATEAVTAANQRESAIGAVVSAGDALEVAWSGGDGGGNGGGQGGGESLNARTPDPAQVRLQALRTDSASDQVDMTTLRASLDLAIQEGSAPGIDQAFHSMEAIDDGWQAGVKAEVQSVLGTLETLNATLQAAMSPAEAADAGFNALFDTASSSRSLAESMAEPLSSLHESVVGYQRAVAAAVQSGQVGSDATSHLLRSVELLQESEAKVAKAVQDIDALATKLAQAQGIAQRVLLSAALAATIRGNDILAQATGLRDEILQNIDAIESARFSAFYATASAGVAGLEDWSGKAQTRGGDAISLSSLSQSDADTAERDIQEVVTLADAMDAFWTGVGPNSEISRKGRMQQLAALSLEDRQAMSGMLQSLQESIGVQDPTGASLFLSDMFAMDQKWNGVDGGLLAEAESIHTQVKTHMDAVDAALGTASGSRQAFEQRLALAQARRDGASEAAQNLQTIKGKLDALQADYERLVELGRGGSAGAQQVAQARADLEGVLSAYSAGMQASVDAAAAVQTAQTYGQRVFFSAASDAHARAAVQLLEATGLRDSIRGNAQAIHADYTTGKQAYDTAFPPRGP